MTAQAFLQKIDIPEGRLSIDVEYKAKSSYPLEKSVSPEGTIGEHIAPPVYSFEQDETWKMLLQKHAQLLDTNQYLCAEYQEGMKKLNFSKNHVSHLKDVSAVLKQATQWQVIRVEGLVGAKNFFRLLANRVFPCTDFIRHKDELNYTPAPDTFHDQVGHLPMITHQRFANFFHLFGLAGINVHTAEELEWFNRIYWFTVEFGLINPTAHSDHYDPSLSQIYGAGIASSCGEIVYCLSEKVQKKPFDPDIVAQTTFDIHHMQELLFEISSFDELERSFYAWSVRNKFLPSHFFHNASCT